MRFIIFWLKMIIFLGMISNITKPIYASETEQRLVIKSGSKDFSCSISMSNNMYTFLFQFDDGRFDHEYKINDARHLIGLVEYAWVIYLEDSDQNVEFGFYYFKTSEEQKIVNINNLLKSGQLSYFVYHDDGLHYINEDMSENLSVKENSAGLSIQLDLSDKNIFSLRPFRYANFWVLNADEAPLKCKMRLNEK